MEGGDKAMMNIEMNTERFVSVKELAEFLAVPCSWVYAQTASGTIPCTRVGCYVRFWMPDVLTWLASNAR